MSHFLSAVRGSQYLDARGQRFKVKLRMIMIIGPFPCLGFLYLYVYANYRCRTVVEYTCIQLHMSLIQTTVDHVFL
jgi:hypothetical protein